jgi:glycerol kinase
MLAEVVDSSGEIALTSAGVLGAAVPIAGIAGDQQAALYGQHCQSPGQAKNTYGTGCFLLMHAGDRPVQSAHGLLGTVAWRRGGRCEHALEGSVFTAGAVVQWLRDGLGILREASQVEALAASVADSGGVILVPAFTGLGAPYWDADARGAILGLTRGSTAAHIARAALESIALQSAEVLAAMQADAGMALTELRVDGGAARNDLLMQFQADVLGVPVLRPALTECTALGAARLAAEAVGLWPREGPPALREPNLRRFEPARPRAWAEDRLADWRAAVARVRG